MRLAHDCVFQALAGLLRSDAGLVRDVVAVCRAAAAELQRPDPAAFPALRAKLAKIEGRVKFIMRNPGETEADERENEEALREARRERSEVMAEIVAIEAARQRPAFVPSESEVVGLTERLDAVFRRAAAPGSEFGLVRDLIVRLTGGRIDLFQQGVAVPRQGWLQGRFRPRVVTTLAGELSGLRLSEEAAQSQEVHVDFHPMGNAAKLVGAVMELFTAGMLIKAIALRLGIGRALVKKAAILGHQQLGLPVPDGRTRRSTLDTKHELPPFWKRVADEAKRLYDLGRYLKDIARELNCDRNTVTQMIRFWHESRGLPVPDGRTRRKALGG